MSEEKFVEMVAPLVDGEDVLGAGVFAPRGTMGAMAGSVGVGGLSNNDVGMAIGVLGAIGAGHATAAVEHQPRWTILAVTPTRVLAFVGEHAGVGWKPGTRYAEFNRESLAVTVHGRVNVQILVLEDLSDHRKIEFEAPRFGPQHGVVVVKLLNHPDPQES